MSGDVRSQAEADRMSQAVRNELLRTPGARCCPFPGCNVITQGGAHGERQHRQVVHQQANWGAT
jgi:hypothetical protein